MKYIYYTLYRLILKVKTNDIPAWSAMLLITMLEFSNITTISLLLPQSFQNQYKTKNEVIFAAIGIAIVLYVINYLVLITNTANLEQKYKNETNNQKLKGVVLLLAYSLISVLSVYFVSVYINGE